MPTQEQDKKKKENKRLLMVFWKTGMTDWGDALWLGILSKILCH